MSGSAINTAPTGVSSPVQTAQEAASKSLYATGAALQVTPEILDALYAAAKIDKAAYNAIAQSYNKALAGFNLCVAALNEAVQAGQDPNQAAAYTRALLSFLSDKKDVDNLLILAGAQPIGQGVTK
jgi:hypothetical protein